jgi:hypothetical protein
MPHDTLHAATIRDSLAPPPHIFAALRPMPAAENPLAPPGGTRASRWMRISPGLTPAAEAAYCAIALGFAALMGWGLIRLI